jgi:hypothetical protein
MNCIPSFIWHSVHRSRNELHTLSGLQQPFPKHFSTPKHRLDICHCCKTGHGNGALVLANNSWRLAHSAKCASRLKGGLCDGSLNVATTLFDARRRLAHDAYPQGWGLVIASNPSREGGTNATDDFVCLRSGAAAGVELRHLRFSVRGNAICNHLVSRGRNVRCHLAVLALGRFHSRMVGRESV